MLVKTEATNAYATWGGKALRTKACTVNSDDCASTPCQNGGTCTDSVGTFQCVCKLGYDGKMCENDIDDCARNCNQYDENGYDTGENHYVMEGPCENGGACTDKVGDFECTCRDGFSGKVAPKSSLVARS